MANATHDETELGRIHPVDLGLPDDVMSLDDAVRWLAEHKERIFREKNGKGYIGLGSHIWAEIDEVVAAHERERQRVLERLAVHERVHRQVLERRRLLITKLQPGERYAMVVYYPRDASVMDIEALQDAVGQLAELTGCRIDAAYLREDAQLHCSRESLADPLKGLRGEYCVSCGEPLPAWRDGARGEKDPPWVNTSSCSEACWRKAEGKTWSADDDCPGCPGRKTGPHKLGCIVRDGATKLSMAADPATPTIEGAVSMGTRCGDG